MSTPNGMSFRLVCSNAVLDKVASRLRLSLRLSTKI